MQFVGGLERYLQQTGEEDPTLATKVYVGIQNKKVFIGLEKTPDESIIKIGPVKNLGRRR